MLTHHLILYLLETLQVWSGWQFTCFHILWATDYLPSSCKPYCSYIVPGDANCCCFSDLNVPQDLIEHVLAAELKNHASTVCHEHGPLWQCGLTRISFIIFSFSHLLLPTLNGNQEWCTICKRFAILGVILYIKIYTVLYWCYTECK